MAIDRRRQRPSSTITGLTRRLLACALAAPLAPSAQAADRAPSEPEFTAPRGSSQPGDQFSGLRYVDPNADGQQSRFSLRAGRSRPLFGDGGYQRGWVADWSSRPTDGGGLLFSYRGGEVDPGLLSPDQLGLDARWLGSRRAEYRLGFVHGSSGVELGRQQVGDLGYVAGLSRDTLRLSGYGFEFQEDTLAVDPDAGFADPLQQAILSPDGLGLGARRLGQAGGGYTALAGLAGGADTYRHLRFAGGSLSAGVHQRRITTAAGALLDRAAEVRVAGVSLRLFERSADPRFSLFKPSGYAGWERLRDGHEQAISAGLDTALVTGSYGLTRTTTGVTGPSDRRARTDIYQGSLTVRPLAGWSVTYGRTDRLSAPAANWAADDRELAAFVENTWRLERTAEASGWSLSARRFADRGQGQRGGEWGGTYRFGELATASYTESNTSRWGDAPEHSRVRRAVVGSSLGLSAATEFAVRNGAGTSHHEARFEREFGPRWRVGVGWENWRGAADPEYAIAGLSEFLDGSTDATAYDASLTVRPGTTEIGLWQRWLLREPGAELTGASETGVTVRQRLLPALGLGIGWSRYVHGSVEREQRRAVALELTDEDLPLLPRARVGYRERLSPDGVDGGWFGSAEIRPYRGLAVEASYAAPSEELLAYPGPESRHALSLAARQTMAGEGAVAVGYTARPVDAPGRAESTADPLARELSLEMTLPRRWLNPALTLTGQYRLRSQPGTDFGADGSQHEQAATLLWAPSEGQNLSIRYSLAATRGASWWDQARQRLEVGYRGRFLGSGHLALQAWLQQQDALFADNEERYRVGVRYDLSFE